MEEYAVYHYRPYEGYHLVFEGGIEDLQGFFDEEKAKATKVDPFYAEDYDIVLNTAVKARDFVERNPRKHWY